MNQMVEQFYTSKYLINIQSVMNSPFTIQYVFVQLYCDNILWRHKRVEINRPIFVSFTILMSYVNYSSVRVVDALIRISHFFLPSRYRDK